METVEGKQESSAYDVLKLSKRSKGKEAFTVQALYSFHQPLYKNPS